MTRKLYYADSILLFTLILFRTSLATAQNPSLHGAYKMQEDSVKGLWLFADDYSSLIYYNDKSYLSTTGGPFTMEGDRLVIKTEYNDLDSTLVGSTVQHQIRKDGDHFIDAAGRTWVKQESQLQDLEGLWRITGRQQHGEMTEMKRGDRKTIKLLVDGFFQWIAINPAARGFYGTGGGEYTFKDNRYAEHIIFFSRDNTRIGTSLQFDGEIKDGKWHHSGLSSTGNEIHEIWSRDKQP